MTTNQPDRDAVRLYLPRHVSIGDRDAVTLLISHDIYREVTAMRSEVFMFCDIYREVTAMRSAVSMFRDIYREVTAMRSAVSMFRDIYREADRLRIGNATNSS